MQARRAGCRESVELAERQVVPTHALTWGNISKLVAEQIFTKRERPESLRWVLMSQINLEVM